MTPVFPLLSGFALPPDLGAILASDGPMLVVVVLLSVMVAGFGIADHRAP